MPSNVESMQLDKYRVLVVDDDRDMVTLLCTWLAEAGFYVDSAPSGADALQRIDITRPNIVVADRWAIICYLRALQRSQNTTAADVPAEHRADHDKPAETKPEATPEATKK